MNKTIIFLATLLASLPALAGPFDPSAGDASMKILGQVFAGLLPGTSGGGPLAEVFKVLNTAILTVAASVVAYTLAIGTLKTAHDGEMLGKRWSSIWVPLRTVLGVALIFPVGGFCAAQMVVMWLAVQGIGIADRAWEAFAASSLARDDTVIQPHTPRVDAFAGQALAALVCVEAINKVVAQTPDASALGATPAGVSSAKDETGSLFGFAGDRIVKREVLNFGGGSVAADACGQIAFENKTDGGTGVASGAGFMGLKWVGFQKQLVPPTATEAAHRQAAAALVQGLQPLARAIV